MNIYSIIQNHIKVLRNHIISIALLIVFGIIGGALFGIFKGGQRYQAAFIIAAEQEKSSGWENLLAQFGMETGGTNPGGVFVGESLVRLFSVRSTVENVLLQSYDSSQLIAEKLYPDLSESTRKKLLNVKFNKDRKQNNTATDSALWFLYKWIIKDVLEATKPDKKQTFININCTHHNDTVALRLADAFIKVVTDKFVYSITRNVRKNLMVLRLEADSIKQVMDYNIRRNANNMDYNINPLQQTAKIEQNKSLIDMQISISLYGEIVKNLKLAELALKKQTPLIEVVDVPQFPIEKTGFPTWLYAIFGGVSGLILSFIMLHVTGKFDT